jgi:hypothetical protein
MNYREAGPVFHIGKQMKKTGQAAEYSSSRESAIKENPWDTFGPETGTGEKRTAA